MEHPNKRQVVMRDSTGTVHSPPAMQITELPTELLGKFAAYMAIDEIKGLADVSRMFRSLAESGVFWHNISRLTASDIKELPKASQRFVAPTHLDLRGLDASTASTVLPALLTSRVLLSRVKGLRLDSTCPIHLIPYLLSGCHNIVSVSLRQITALTDDHLRLITSPNLAQIDLTGCWKVTDAGLQHLLATTGKVKKFLGQGVWKLTAKTINKIPTSWPNIEVLDLTNSFRTWSPADAVHILSSCRHLQAVRFNDCKFTGDQWQALLRRGLRAQSRSMTQTKRVRPKASSKAREEASAIARRLPFAGGSEETKDTCGDAAVPKRATAASHISCPKKHLHLVQCPGLSAELARIIVMTLNSSSPHQRKKKGRPLYHKSPAAGAVKKHSSRAARSLSRDPSSVPLRRGRSAPASDKHDRSSPKKPFVTFIIQVDDKTVVWAG